MNTAIKGLLLIVTILYVLSPIDGFPGPIDDTLVILLNLAAQKKLSN